MARVALHTDYGQATHVEQARGMAKAPALVLADVVLINTLAALVCEITPDRTTRALRLSLVREVLPACQRNHVLVGPVARAAEKMLAAERGDGPAWARAHFEARLALRRLFEWRAARAHQQWLAEQAAGAA